MTRHRFRIESLEQRMMLAGDSIAEGESPPFQVIPDFQLVDVNPNSATFNTPVSPRDFLNQAGALYFAHST